MDVVTFSLGLLTGLILGVILMVFVMYLLAKPHLLKAKQSKQKTQVFVEKWAENLAKSAHDNKFGGGNR